MAVHAVSDKSLRIVDMCGGFPGIVGRLDFVAGGAELRRRGADHRVVGNAENRKTDNDPKTDEERKVNEYCIRSDEGSEEEKTEDAAKALEAVYVEVLGLGDDCGVKAGRIEQL